MSTRVKLKIQSTMEMTANVKPTVKTEGLVNDRSPIGLDEVEF